tara:strand:- start:147 stop:719 length:573 start_codon:yes stop_codon:yes gene_type:complete
MKRTNYKPKLDKKAFIELKQGECFMTSEEPVAGIQLYFKGVAEITPTLPDGWLMQGNQGMLLIVSLQGLTLTDQMLFTYIGEMYITKAIICNKNSERLTEMIIEDNLDWRVQNFEFDSENVDWNDMKLKVKNKTANKTIYNLPDYDLPKVTNNEINKIKNRKIRQKTSEAYTPRIQNVETSGGSSGTGGY